jgi:hypothetical protein
MMAPAVDALAAHLQGKALIAKLNGIQHSRHPDHDCLQRWKGGRAPIWGDSSRRTQAAGGKGGRGGLIARSLRFTKLRGLSAPFLQRSQAPFPRTAC